MFRKILAAAAVLAVLAALALSPVAHAGGDVGHPADTFAIAGASGNVANATATATLTVTAGQRAFMCSFSITGGGATAGALVNATITGLTGGTQTFVVGVATGVTVGNAPIVFDINPCVPAASVGTNIVLTVPALGAGNTNSAATITGYRY